MAYCHVFPANLPDLQILVQWQRLSNLWKRKKEQEKSYFCQSCYMYKFKFKIDTTLSEMSQSSITVIKLMQMKPNFMILNKVWIPIKGIEQYSRLPITQTFRGN